MARMGGRRAASIRGGGLVVLVAALAACAELEPERPPPVARPVPVEPWHLEIAAIRSSPLCSSPYPIDAVKPFIVRGGQREPMQDRYDPYGRPLFGVRTNFGELSP